MTGTLINYVEFKAQDLEAIKNFYSNTFGWSFTDYGPDYVSFDNSGLQGGFEKSGNPVINGALVVLYSEQLEAIQASVKAAGGSISKEIFSSRRSPFSF